MGADKNSSRRINSTYAPTSQPRIPTWACQGHVVTTDLPNLGKSFKQSQSESTTQEAKDSLRLPGGRSTRGRRTVRGLGADGPQKDPEPPVCTLWNSDGPRAHHRRSAPRGWSENNFQPKPTDPTDRNEAAQELVKNSTSTWPVNTSRTVRRQRANGPPGTKTSTRAQPPKGQHLHPFAWSPKSTKGLLQNHRWRWSASRRCYIYEFVSSNPPNWEESRFYRDHTKS
jgi:hypothetical protein